MTATTGTPAFVGRAAEIEVLGTLVAGRGAQRVALVRGEPGIGKTELLARIDTPGRTVRVGGSESEAHLPFAVLADLVLPLREALAALPDVQREALEVSVALRAGRPGGSLAVCAATLGLLEAAGDAEPLLVVVDDLQWVDTPSQEVLLFVARRVRSARVALVLATRDRSRSVPGARVVDLDGLGTDESRLLLGPLAERLPPVALDRLVEDLAGHPLALVENARHLPDHRSRTPRPGPALAALWTGALEGLPGPARTAVAAVAGAGSADADVVDRVLTDLGVSIRDQQLAERAGLLRDDADRRVLRHPLLRAVVLGADPATTRRVHLALAARTTGARRAWHLAATVDGTDDAVAAQLAVAAAAASERGGHRSSGEAWARAAQLTTDRRRRAERFLAAARGFLLAGTLDLAAGHAEAAATLDDDAGFAARVEMVRGRATAWLGDPRRAHLDLVDAAERVAPRDPETAAALYAEATMPAGMAGRVHAMLDLARRASDLAPGAAAPAQVCALVLGGETPAALALLERLDADPPGDLQVGAQLAQAAVHTERYEDAERRIGALLTAGRRHGVASVLAYGHAVRAELEVWRGRWPAARADAVEARQWAEELGEPGTAALATMILARLDAATGALERSRAGTRRVLAEVGTHGIDSLQVYGPAVEGLAALVAGDTDDAVDHLEAAHRRARAGGLEASNVVPYGPDLVEALVRSGRGDRAREVLDWWATKATDLAFPAASTERCRGLLADDPDEAAACFVRAREVHARCDQPAERARTLLAEAECLRRWRRPTAARVAARDAHALFVALGAGPWAARAEGELAAAGVPSPRRAPAGAAWAALTPQEFQVARVVAEGRSNDEAAAALFVSRKTVENHLTRVYRKLGLRSRSELVRRFPGGPTGGSRLP